MDWFLYLEPIFCNTSRTIFESYHFSIPTLPVIIKYCPDNLQQLIKPHNHILSGDTS